MGRTAGGNTTSRRISPSSSLLGELDMGVLCCGDFFNATEWTHVHGNAEVKLNELVRTVGPVADRFGRRCGQDFEPGEVDLYGWL